MNPDRLQQIKGQPVYDAASPAEVEAYKIGGVDWIDETLDRVRELIDQATCKNCRHWERSDTPMPGTDYGFCPVLDAAFCHDFSCAGFEPREGEQ